MPSHRSLFLALGLMAGAFLASCSVPVPAGYALVWDDEFDRPGVPDPKKWFFETEGNRYDWYNNEAQNYTDPRGTPDHGPNAWVEGGNLIIEARKEPWVSPVDDEQKAYTSARLKTAGLGDWQYGRVEVRARLPRGKGTWPAIWMLNSEYSHYPTSGEIDLMEAIGSEPGTIYTNVWSQENVDSHGHSFAAKVEDPFGAYHVYALDWTESKLSILIDGTPIQTYEKGAGTLEHWPYFYKFHLLLNVALGGDWEGEVDDRIFSEPVRMLVDHVRVYQKKG